MPGVQLLVCVHKIADPVSLVAINDLTTHYYYPLLLHMRGLNMLPVHNQSEEYHVENKSSEGEPHCNDLLRLPLQLWQPPFVGALMLQ